MVTRPMWEAHKAAQSYTEVAKQFLDNGIFIIPLLPNEKKNWDTDILTKDYTVSDLDRPEFVNGNLGINLKKSNLYC